MGLSRFRASPSRPRPIVEHSNLSVATNERKCFDRAHVERFLSLLKKIGTRAMQLTDRRYREFYAQRMVVDPDKRARRAKKGAPAAPRGAHRMGAGACHT